ncbi:uncharacterized protein DUF1579 [Tepidamorphus gemmatus]|uniref:Uncharacterized protein DUF1579 n=1 Tax=Tepidamorphus gemmatus TaxID=747076 RepID=A0A4R3M173_9HYPH|nr:DUF1579 family protein [Tepidamorphus gemmatus]TCT06453.1 uncharacterized protein DUF1579 [Tepidamorphus gemmatus]
MRRLLSIFPMSATLLLALPANPASADALLDSLKGTWRGSGAVRTSGSTPSEKVVCRVEGAMDGPGDLLKLDGRCGGEGFTGTFQVTIAYDAGRGRYTAVWRDSLGSKSPPLTGLKSGNRVVFRIGHNDFESEGRAVSTLVVDPQSATRLRITGQTIPAHGGAEFVSADLVFDRS